MALLVLGMHRSGTSALTRVLNLLGVALGDDLMPPGPDNPLGFWEHQALAHASVGRHRVEHAARTFTCRMSLPVPSSRPCGSDSSAP